MAFDGVNPAGWEDKKRRRQKREASGQGYIQDMQVELVFVSERGGWHGDEKAFSVRIRFLLISLYQIVVVNV